MIDQQLKAQKQTIAKLENRYLKNEAGSAYIVNEDLDHSFTKDEDKRFDEYWKQGYSLVRIAEMFKRDPDEVFLLMFDRARKHNGKLKITWNQIWSDVG
ncbi:hypothetical protein SAMN05192534_12427 [Alteribacillus persepolensis]|uniref:Uncharacterized protein n=1 Tax=Alteribacillus persepolensis TaxID=568899 RepID=A0A1G8II30_9BACI|nr:hypothetical protein [Alteribacillus persepolensis]SDI18457.1 hypothetical protein SAMN05192534_12427 [Alteribacillus persepolensis]